MELVIDFDSTTAITHKALFDLYREETGDYGTELKDGFSWSMGEVCRNWTLEQFNNCFINPRLFDHLVLFDDCYDVLKRLHDKGRILKICSLHQKEGIPYKKAWIEKNLPFIDEVIIIPIDAEPSTFDKSSVKGDIIIDDRIDCLSSSPCNIKICYGSYSWNYNWQKLRAVNWIELEELINDFSYLKEYLEYIKTHEAFNMYDNHGQKILNHV